MPYKPESLDNKKNQSNSLLFSLHKERLSYGLTTADHRNSQSWLVHGAIQRLAQDSSKSFLALTGFTGLLAWFANAKDEVLNRCRNIPTAMVQS